MPAAKQANTSSLTNYLFEETLILIFAPHFSRSKVVFTMAVRASNVQLNPVSNMKNSNTDSFATLVLSFTAMIRELKALVLLRSPGTINIRLIYFIFKVLFFFWFFARFL